MLCEQFSSLSEIIGTNISIYDNNFHNANVQNAKNNSLCSYLNSEIQKRCNNSDSKALKRAQESDSPFYYNCHFGYIEIMIPYQIDNETKIYVVIGPFKDLTKEDEVKNRIKEICELTHKDYIRSIESFSITPIFTEEKYNSVVNIINTIIEYAKKVNWISIMDGFVKNELDPYLAINISKNILTSDLTSRFYYTAKQLESIVKKQTGLTPKKYILYYKMNYAKNKLVSTNESLQNIAYSVGFDDYNYFIKVFKSFYKETPLQYRKLFSNNINKI